MSSYMSLPRLGPTLQHTVIAGTCGGSSREDILLKLFCGKLGWPHLCCPSPSRQKQLSSNGSGHLTWLVAEGGFHWRDAVVPFYFCALTMFQCVFMFFIGFGFYLSSNWGGGGRKRE